MPKINYITSIAVAVLIGGGGFYILQSRSDTLSENDARTNNLTAQAIVEANQPAQDYTTDFSQERGAWLPYDEARLADANSGNVVLFFSAAWCPTCQIAKKNFAQNANLIPKGLTILDLDFDKETDLRKKYGVTLQHTFVEVDVDGNELRQWNQSFVIDQLIAELQKT